MWLDFSSHIHKSFISNNKFILIYIMPAEQLKTSKKAIQIQFAHGQKEVLRCASDTI